ncbi:MAG: hypothetical protein E6K81_00470 [Candidatus Eisenbacteria bacterium]|uniref:Redoxin domain-containing protein n=1 Tax=Eiseniibacteriota bacterium TaxID=2212470 RepID=A0A538UED3_UNCEI|nr:MAG: hypothetical protein E6K81_00470 [Candidatus Eisenbacteria bacterium]
MTRRPRAKALAQAGSRALAAGRLGPAGRGRPHPPLGSPRLKTRGSATVPRVPSRPPQPSLLGRPLPDLALPDARGGSFALRQFVGRGPLVLFFYILNGSPG